MGLKKSSLKLNHLDEKLFIKNCYLRISTKSFSKKLIGCSLKQRSVLLRERRSKLVQVAQSDVPDAIVSYACKIYLQTYFGSERQMVYELIKGQSLWFLHSFQARLEVWFKKTYYLYFRGHTEEEWESKINSEIL